MGGKKAGGGFMGIGGESGFLNTGLLSSGPPKIKGFSMSDQMKSAENAMIMRQNALAKGAVPAYAQQAMGAMNDQANAQAMALAASQRGASNPALAFRNAQIMNQQNNLESVQQAALMAEQQRMQADQLIAAQAAAQRGVAFQQASTNLGALQANQRQNAEFLSAIGGSAMKASGGSSK